MTRVNCDANQNCSFLRQNSHNGLKPILVFVFCLFVQGSCCCYTYTFLVALRIKSVFAVIHKATHPIPNSRPRRVYNRKVTWIQWWILNSIDLPHCPNPISFSYFLMSLCFGEMSLELYHNFIVRIVAVAIARKSWY